MTGSGKHAPSTRYKIAVFKVNNAGVLQWAFRMDDTIENVEKYNYIRDAAVLPNGDVVLAGYIDRHDSSLDDTFLIKLNSQG